jgi:hypothetical protein
VRVGGAWGGRGYAVYFVNFVVTHTVSYSAVNFVVNSLWHLRSLGTTRGWPVLDSERSLPTDLPATLRVALQAGCADEERWGEEVSYRSCHLSAIRRWFRSSLYHEGQARMSLN